MLDRVYKRTGRHCDMCEIGFEEGHKGKCCKVQNLLYKCSLFSLILQICDYDVCSACLLLEPAVEPIPVPSSQQIEPIQAANPQHVEPIQAPSPQQIRRSPFRGNLASILSPSLRDLASTHEPRPQQIRSPFQGNLAWARETSREQDFQFPSAHAQPQPLRLNQDALSLLCRIRRGNCNRLLPMGVRACTELLPQLRDAASTIFHCPLPDAIALRALDVSRYLPDSAGMPTVLGAFRCLTDGERGLVSDSKPSIPTRSAEPSLNVSTVLEAAADAHDASSHHEVVNVPSKSPARHPARTSYESTSIVTFSTLQKGGSVVRSPPIPSSRCPMMSRMKLKRNLAISSNSSAAVDDATLLEDLECMSFPVALQSTASFDAPVALPKTPTSLCARSPLKVPSPSKPVLSPTPIPLQTKSTASPQPFKAAVNKAAVGLPALFCVKSGLESPIPLTTDSPPIQDDSPVSRLQTFRELMKSRPGTYGFITSTQTDGVHVESRGTQTSPPRPTLKFTKH